MVISMKQAKWIQRRSVVLSNRSFHPSSIHINGWRRLISSTMKAQLSDDIDVFYKKDSLPLKRFIGPLKTMVVEGKGRGVVATAEIQPGDLLMICEPLAFLRGPDGQRPQGETLIDKATIFPHSTPSLTYLLDNFDYYPQILAEGRHTNPWFKDYLFDGTQQSIIRVPDFSSETSDLRSASNPSPVEEIQSSTPPVVTKKGFSSSSSSSSTSSSNKGVKMKRLSGRKGSMQESYPGGVDRQTAIRVAKAVSLNCFGDAHDDRAAANCRGVLPTSHLGVWPEMSMINHSCSPNSINYVLGEAMVIRAAAPISLGDEITISYLGKPQLHPVNMRINELRENYSFTCECERCTAELIHMEKISGQYEELHERSTSDLGPRFILAQKLGDHTVINEIRDELRSSLSGLFLTFRKVLLQPQVRNFFLASLYELLELQIACESESMHLSRSSHESTDAPASNDSQPIILQTLNHCVKALKEVSPGSDLHCILSSKLLRASIELNGQGSPQAALAWEACKSAHLYRYGPTSERLTRTLIEHNRTLYD